MKMLTQYNYGKALTSNIGITKSIIRTYLSAEIDYLLAPSNESLSKEVDIDKLFVKKGRAEDSIRDFLYSSNYTSGFFILTGLTGTGKTTVINKAVGYYTSPTVRFDKENGDTLIIPISFNDVDGDHETTISDITVCFKSALKSAVNCIRKEYNIDVNGLNYSEIIDYFESTRSSLINYDLYEDINAEDKYKRAIDQNVVMAYAHHMFYYITKRECNISKVVFVVDNIEGTGGNLEDKPINIVYSIYSAFDKAKISNCLMKVIIGCRNYVYRYVFVNNQRPRQRIESFPNPITYHLDKDCPSMSEIIKKRYDNMPTHYREKREKNEKWDSAMSVINELLMKLDKQYGGVIQNLNIRNIRNSFMLLKDIVYNTMWVQRDSFNDIAEGFDISALRQFSTSQANIIRAIGMGDNTLYNSERVNCKLPNLLYNENETDLLSLLLIRYCMNKTGLYERKKYADWSETIRRNNILQEIDLVFGGNNNELKDKFDNVFNYLVNKRILLRSKDQVQIDTEPVNESNMGKVECVYISNAAVDLWDLMGETSVLLEMYMDDIFLDNDDRSRKALYRGFDGVNYAIAIKYIFTLCEIERTFFTTAVNCNRTNYYLDFFGETPIVRHLYRGMRQSFNSYYTANSETKKNFSTELHSLNEEICLFEKYIEDEKNK